MADVETYGAETVLARVCPDCERPITGKSLGAMERHRSTRHPEAGWRAEDLELQEVDAGEVDRRRREDANAAAKRYQDRTRAGHTAPSPSTKAPPSSELAATERALAQNIEAVGAMLAGALHMYKGWVATHPGASIRIAGQERELPYLESTFGHVIASRSRATAGVVMGYAADNPTLMRWVQRFNLAMTGGAMGGLVIDHALGAAHTAIPTNDQLVRFAGMRVPEALNKVMAENAELQAQVEELQRRAESNGGPSA